MTLKNAALLALVERACWRFCCWPISSLDVANAACGLIPAIQVLASFVHALAGVSVRSSFTYSIKLRLDAAALGALGVNSGVRVDGRWCGFSEFSV
jgi:hypothetical protein